MATKERQGPIYERLLSEGEKRQKEKEQEVERYARLQLSNLQDKPTIDPVSLEIVKNKHDMQKPTLERLLHDQPDKKRALLQALKEKKEAELKVHTEIKVQETQAQNRWTSSEVESEAEATGVREGM
jgi:hypothetical protein